MDLLEVSVRADGEAAEAISEVFNRYGTGGAVIEEQPGAEPRAVVVRAYLPADDALAGKRRALEEALWHLARIHPFPEPQFRTLAESDWANAWKAFHPVQRVGAHIVLKPTWREHDTQPGDLVIELDPGMAFGTGQHPSTRLSLLAIERHLRAGARVLDIGTGSGILAILCARLGADRVVACDIDPLAVAATAENAARNGVADRVRVLEGSLGDHDFGAGEWDMLLMNILAPVIVNLLPLARPLLAPGGLAVLAGLIESQADEVRAAMDEAGLAEVDRMQEADWVMLVGKAVDGER